jgi:hypothetical protein
MKGDGAFLNDRTARQAGVIDSTIHTYACRDRVGRAAAPWQVQELKRTTVRGRRIYINDNMKQQKNKYSSCLFMFKIYQVVCSSAYVNCIKAIRRDGAGSLIASVAPLRYRSANVTDPLRHRSSAVFKFNDAGSST